MQELAIVGMVRAGKAHRHHVMVPTIGGEIEPHVFYKLDCPDPNLRRDGSVWPNPPGVISKRKFEGQIRLIPQEQIY